MDFRFVSMTEETFILTNGPLVLFITAANIFYGLSLFLNRRRLKPPVRVLLGSVICFAIVYCNALIVVFYCLVNVPNSIAVLVFWIVGLHSTHSSMTCNVCLHFYYYIHIVPARKALFFWIKRNIGPIINVVLIGTTVLYTVSGAFSAAETIFHGVRELTHNNYTQTGHEQDFFHPSRTWFVIIQLYVLLGLWIMMFSSFSTVCYLQRHMRSMARSGGRLTTPLHQSQMRVAITGIVQGLLCVLFYAHYFTESLVYIFFEKTLVSAQVSLTIITVYLSSSTVILGIGQVTIRQSAAAVLKALKVQCVAGMVTNDGTTHCSPS